MDENEYKEAAGQGEEAALKAEEVQKSEPAERGETGEIVITPSPAYTGFDSSYFEKEQREKALFIEAKAQYLKTAVGILTFYLVSLALQTVLSIVINRFFPYIAEQGWYMWALSVLPMYLAAFPIAFIIFSLAKAKPPEKKKISLGEWVIYFTVASFLMYVGNFVSIIAMTAFETIFGAPEPGNALLEAVGNSDTLATFIAAVVIAPIMEELIFRKLLLDRLARYGEFCAIIFSALSFGLLHGNFYQFLYAFMLGALFAFVYLKTGRIIYTILLHAVINFMGSIVVQFLLEKTKLLDTMLAGELKVDEPLWLVALLAYYGAVFGIFILGLIFLIAYANRIKFNKGESTLPGSLIGKATFGNVGTIVMLSVSGVILLLSLFIQ